LLLTVIVVENNADLDKKNGNGLIPIDIAVENEHVETVQFLLS